MPSFRRKVLRVGDVSNPKDRNERRVRTGRGHGTLPRPKKGGHTLKDPRIGAGKKGEEGKEPSPSETGRMPPFRGWGENRGSSAHFVPSYRQNQAYIPVRCTPYPKHAEEDHGSLRTVRSPSSRIVSHPPSVGVEPLSSKDGSQTSRPRCSLVHTFGVDFWTRRNVSHISSRRRLHDPRSSGNETHAQAQALSSPREKRSSKP